MDIEIVPKAILSSYGEHVVRSECMVKLKPIYRSRATLRRMATILSNPACTRSMNTAYPPG
jgi:hypothetical protein